MSATTVAGKVTKLSVHDLADRPPTLDGLEVSPNLALAAWAAAISAKHQTLGGKNGFLGPAVTPYSKTPNGKGWYRHYQNGSIYWSQATGAHEVHGLIRGKWASMGWEQSFLGFPMSDETPGGAGRFNRFEGGAIYWSPQTGAFEVHGDILAKYLSLGAEKSFLGYPTSDELASPDGVGRYSDFQHGQIAWSPSLGAAVSFTTYEPTPGGLGLKPQGLGGNDLPEVRRRLTCAADMHLTDHETFGSNEHSSASKTGEAVLTNDLPQDVLRLEDGAGGELRVELKLVGQAKTNGDVLVQGQALLFEGTSETSNDLDGDESFTVLVPRDGFISRDVTVVNEDEGGDKGVITMTFSNHQV